MAMRVCKRLSNYGRLLRQPNHMFHVKRRLDSNEGFIFDCKGDNRWQLKEI